MRIESKATGKVHFVTKEQWDNMEGYRKRLYNVVDATDSNIPTTAVKEIKIETPRDVFEIDHRQAEIEELLRDCTRADIKELLNEEGIDYGTNDLHRELAEKYCDGRK